MRLVTGFKGTSVVSYTRLPRCNAHAQVGVSGWIALGSLDNLMARSGRNLVSSSCLDTMLPFVYNTPLTECKRP